jgi:putative oxidoreductase
MSGIVNLGNRILNVAPAWAWLPPLLARIVLGWIFIGAGWAKLGNLDGVAGFFASLGIPAAGFMALLVGVVELVGGLMVLVGLGTRLASIPLGIIMIVALTTAKAGDITGIEALFSIRDTLYLVLLLWLITSGPGPVSVDSKVAAKYRG